MNNRCPNNGNCIQCQYSKYIGIEAKEKNRVITITSKWECNYLQVKKIDINFTI